MGGNIGELVRVCRNSHNIFPAIKISTHFSSLRSISFNAEVFTKGPLKVCPEAWKGHKIFNRWTWGSVNSMSVY